MIKARKNLGMAGMSRILEWANKAELKRYALSRMESRDLESYQRRALTSGTINEILEVLNMERVYSDKKR